MSTTDIGRVGEAAVLAKLTKCGWYPFVDISGKCPVDIMAWKDGRTISIQVKTVTNGINGAWSVQIGSIRPNRTGNTIHKFDGSQFDYLAVYLTDIDKVAFIPADSITSGRSLTIRQIDNGRAKVLLSDYEEI